MLTQCPNCQTVFRVTSAILRAAHGQVRCGRCHTQFDAIEKLLDVEEPTDEGAAAAQSDDDATGEYAAENVSHEDIVLEGNRIEISGVYRQADNAPEAEAAHARTVIEEFNIGTEEWENPFDEPERTSPVMDDIEADDIEVELETELEDVEQVLEESSLADALASLDEAAPDTEALQSEDVVIATPTPPARPVTPHSATAEGFKRRPTSIPASTSSTSTRLSPRSAASRSVRCCVWSRM